MKIHEDVIKELAGLVPRPVDAYPLQARAIARAQRELLGLYEAPVQGR